MDSKLESCKFVQGQLRSLNSTYIRAPRVTAALIKTRLDTEELLEQTLNGFINVLSLQAAKHASDLAQHQQPILPSITKGKNTSIIPFSDWKTSTVLRFNSSKRNESVSPHNTNQNNRKNQSSAHLKYRSQILSKIQQIHFKRNWMHEQRQKYHTFIMNLNKSTFNLSQLPYQKNQVVITPRGQLIFKPSFDLSYLQTLNHIINSIETIPSSSTFQVFTLVFQQHKYEQSSPRFLNPLSQISNKTNNILNSYLLQSKAIITKFLGKLAFAAYIQQSIENEQHLDSQQLQQTKEEFKCNGKSIHRVIKQALNICLQFLNKQKAKCLKEKIINKSNNFQNQYHLISEDILLSLGFSQSKNTRLADKDQGKQPQHVSSNGNSKNNYFPRIFQFSPVRSDSNYQLDCQQSLKQRYYKLVKLRLFSLENSSETSTTKRMLSLASDNKHKSTVPSTLTTLKGQQNNYSPSYFSSPEATSSNNRKQLKQHKIDTYFKPPSENQHFPSLDNQFPAYIVKDYSIPQDNKQSEAKIQQNDEQNSQLTFSDLPQVFYFQEPDKQNQNFLKTNEQVEMSKRTNNSDHIDLMKDKVNGQQYAQNNINQLTRQQEMKNSTNDQSLQKGESIFTKLDGYKFSGDTLNHLHVNTIKTDKFDKLTRMNNNSNFSKNLNSLVTAQTYQIHHLKQRQSLFQKVKARTQASILRDSNIQRDLFNKNTANELAHFNNKNNYERSNFIEEQISIKPIQKSQDSRECLNLNSSKSSYSNYNNITTGYLTPSRRQIGVEDFKLTRELSNNTREQIKVNKQGNKNQQNQQENYQKCYYYGQNNNIIDENEATTEHSREINLVLSQFLSSKD